MSGSDLTDRKPFGQCPLVEAVVTLFKALPEGWNTQKLPESKAPAWRSGYQLPSDAEMFGILESMYIEAKAGRNVIVARALEQFWEALWQIERARVQISLSCNPGETLAMRLTRFTHDPDYGKLISPAVDDMHPKRRKKFLLEAWVAYKEAAGIPHAIDRDGHDSHGGRRL